MNPENEDSIHDFLQSQITDTPLSLNNELSNMGVKFNHRNDFEEIKTFIDEFIDGNNVNRYIVLPGLRGVGKTTILFQIYDYLLNIKNIKYEQILYFSCEELNKIEDCDIYDTIKYYLKTFHNSSLQTLDEKLFLLIDESHFDKDWSISGKIITNKSKNICVVGKRFFTAPSIALAEVHFQDLVNAVAKKNGLPIISLKTLKAVETGDLKEMRLAISCCTEIGVLNDFLYDISTQC